MIVLLRKSRVKAAVLISLASNCLLLVASFTTDPRGGPPSVASRIVEVLGLPGGVVASAFTDGEHGGGAQILVMLGSLILFYAAIAWLVLRLCIHSPEGQMRA